MTHPLEEIVVCDECGAPLGQWGAVGCSTGEHHAGARLAQRHSLLEPGRTYLARRSDQDTVFVATFLGFERDGEPVGQALDELGHEALTAAFGWGGPAMIRIGDLGSWTFEPAQGAGE